MDPLKPKALADTVTISLDLPGEIYDLLQAKHSKGALSAIRTAIKLYLKNGRPVKNAARDAEIYRKCQTTRYADVAKEYKLSLVRIQQIVDTQKIKRTENM